MYTQVSFFLSHVKRRFNILSQLALVLHFCSFFHWRLRLACDVADCRPFWKDVQLEEPDSPRVDGHHDNSQANQIYTQTSFYLQKQNASEQLNQKQLT